MKIHREGKVPILIGTLTLVSVLILIYLFIPHKLVQQLALVPFIVFYMLILWFFRIPVRHIVKNDKLVIAPADGKVVVIEKVTEKEYFHDQRIQVSIFMSPLNVHQNVYPVDGKVVYKKYHKGKYLVAWHPKSSTDNERSTIVVKLRNGTEILIRQIAGAVARRILTYPDIEEIAVQGHEFGFIRFGSRVDVLLPLDARIVCSLNEKAISKQTILAELP